MFKSYIQFLFVTLVVTTFSACVDLEFDEPPVGDLTELTANMTIAEAKALYTGSDDVAFPEGTVLKGQVMADDASGNFYKQIIVQDETGGLAVRMNATGLAGDFPAGSWVGINCDGLYMSEYNGFPQINGAPGEAIESTLISEHVFLTQAGDAITATPMSVADLQNTSAANYKAAVATLIELTDVQFAQVDAGATYADAENSFSLNRTLEDCDENTMVVRTSGYCDFAADLTPEGKGTLVAILSVFGDTPQLTIRDLTDVDMEGPRCTVGSGSEQLMSIADVRAGFDGGNPVLPAERKIRGIVISDRANGNIHGLNMVVQDGNAGIVVRFDGDHNFNMGDEVEVIVSELEITEFNGLMQISGVSTAAAVKLGDGTLPTPQVLTTAQIAADSETYESTLVRINGVTLQAGTFGGGNTITDAAGTFPMYTSNSASFAGATVPSGTLDIIGIASQFNDAQLNIRNLDDVIGGSTGGGGDAELMDISALRTIFADGGSNVPADRKISGVVISDYANGNIHGQNLVIQDGTAGIVVRFDAPHTFALGEEIEVIISNLELSEYNGLLQVNNVPVANVDAMGMGTMPTPTTLTIADFLANSEDYESTLVKFVGLTCPDGGTYAGPKTLTDGTNDLPMYTRNDASFSGDNMPTGTFTITGIASQFMDAQINIRNTSDVE